MDYFKICLRIIRRDPEVDRDHVLFVFVFFCTFVAVILLTVVTLVFGDGATFVHWLLGK
jgi:hypothetical protein